MGNTITYADLDELLVGNGFVRKNLSKEHVVYLDRAEEPIFVFPALPLDEAVEPVHLAAVRRWLIDAGLLQEEGIERWLWQLRFAERRPAPAAAAVGPGRAAGVG